MDLQSSVALVTGANRGLGLAIVKELLTAGVSKVYAAARDPKKLSSLNVDPRMNSIGIDVTDAEGIRRAAAVAGDVTLLINNAGVLEFGGALDVSEAAIERSLRTNFWGPLLTARAFAPVLQRNGGCAILNVLSLLSLTNEPGFSSYCASKFAAWSITQSLRHDLQRRNISVIAVFPGGIDTEMLASVSAQKASPTSVAKRIVDGLRAGQSDIYPDPVSMAFRRI